MLPDGSIVLMGGWSGDGQKNDVWRSTDNGATWTQMTASPGWSERYDHSSVVLPDGSIVLMGGREGGDEKNDVWRSTDNGATWTQVTASAEWSPRYDHSSVVLPDGSIVVIGGFDGGSANDVWRSTDKGATWTQMTAKAEWSPRYGHSSVALPDGSIVVIGGFDGGSAHDIWRSADNGTTWSLVYQSAGWKGRYDHSSVALPDGSIVLMGGLSGDSMNDDVWRSMDNGKTWTLMTASAGWSPEYGGHSSVALPDGSIVLMNGQSNVWQSTDNGKTWTQISDHTSFCWGHSSVALPDGSIVLMGGYWSNEVLRSTDNGKTWTEMTASPGWSERYDHSSVALPDGSIVLMGGLTSEYPNGCNDVWRSTDNGKTWTEMTASAEWPPRYGHSSVALPDGSIVLMGGRGEGGGAKNDVWRSTDNGATWTRVAADAGWLPRYEHSSVALPDGSIVLMGGLDNNNGYLYDVWRLETGIGSSLIIEDISPKGITNVGSSTLTITGNGFSSDTTVRFQHLEYPQYSIQSEERFDSQARIYATVDWTGALEGHWDLIVEDPEGQKQVKKAAIFVSRAAEIPQKENPSITIKESQKLWIDPISEDNRQVTISYLITPADYSGRVIMEVSNASGERVGNITKTVTLGGEGFLTWDGKINSELVNQANTTNPYTIKLRLEGGTESDLKGVTSEPQKVFVGRPVLFVHGINSLAKDIEHSSGYQAFSEDHYTVAVEYAESKVQTFFGNIPQFSGRLGQEIERIKEETGAAKVDIVAHSMGGLVSRYYIEKLGGRGDIGKLIMVQTPNHGSELADLRALHDYAGDVKKASTLVTTFGLTTVVDEVVDELIPSAYNYLVEFGFAQYDTTALGQMAPYHRFIVDLNGNERPTGHKFPYSSDFYMSQNLVRDQIQDPSGYIVIASQNIPTPSHCIATIPNPLTGNALYQKRLPGVTNKGDFFVSYNSAKLTMAPIVGIDGGHLNPWDKEVIMNHLVEFLSDTDGYPKLTAKTSSYTQLTSSELLEETDESSEIGFWSDWITTNVSQSEDLNLKFTIEPVTTSARFLFLWDEGTLSLSFTAPNGTVTDTIISEDQCEYSTGAVPGTWNVTIHPVSIPGDSVELTTASHQINPVIFEVLPDTQGTNPGDALPISVYYGSNSEPCTGATVTATVKSPDGSLNNLTLYDDGSSRDDAAGDGVYSNTFTDTAELGTYLITANGLWTFGNVILSRTAWSYVTLMEYPDLTIDAIIVTPQEPCVGEEIEITATISNIGSADATNVSVAVYGEINSFKYDIDTATLDIPAGDSVSVTTQWKARADLHTIVAVVTSCDEVTEESYSNNIANAMVNVTSSQVELESANITIRDGDVGSVPIILTNCTDLKHVTGTFVFNNSVVEFINVSSTASSVNYANTTGLVRFNITYDDEMAGDISVADIVMRGVGEPGEGTETKVIVNAFDGLGLHGSTMTGSNQITLIKNITDDLELHVNFTADARCGRVPFTVRFTDTSTGDPTSWSWDFGDGVTSTEQNPVHTYTTPGTYTATLTVTNAVGSDSARQTITVTTTQVGSIAVTSAPAGAAIWLDDRNTGTFTNTTLTNIPAGDHVVRVELDGYQTMTKTVTVAAGEMAEVTFVLGSPAITLSPGWNFIAVPKTLNATKNTAGSLFGNVDTGGKNILGYNSQTEMWNPVTAAEIISPLNGYWIYAAAGTDITLSYPSEPASTADKILYPGWNAVGLSADEQKTAETALACLNGSWKTVIPWNLAAGMYDPAIINGGTGTYSPERLMTFGNGYWVYVDSESTLKGCTV